MNVERVQVLDHGHLKFIEHWGSDERIIEAARMSTKKGFLGWGPKGLMCPATGCGWKGSAEEARVAPEPGSEVIEVFTSRCPACKNTGLNTVPGDEKLLRFLWENKHATPFEMAGLTIEVQAPIFVFREWHRHRTQSYNEMSARYTPLPDVNYMPTVDRCLMVSGTNKQAGVVAGADALTHEAALAWLEELSEVYGHAERVYQSGLKRGIPKEVARVPLPVGRYSRMMASTDLRNWLGFATLRMAPSAQYEIRMYANALHDLLAQLFPRTIELFDEGMAA